ncbi:hypothetical protein GS506_16345 [Rhodococcus hoagii]|nr:hypothetical protein [Prescottella equi]
MADRHRAGAGGSSRELPFTSTSLDTPDACTGRSVRGRSVARNRQQAKLSVREVLIVTGTFSARGPAPGPRVI